MNGQEILDLANSLLDEEGRIDNDLGMSLATHIKDLVEAERPWRMLIKRDVSLTVLSSDDWETAKTLPSDFLYETKIVLGDANKSSFTPYDPVGFEERELFKDTRKYCIDYGGGKMFFLGSHDQTYTIYLYYIHQTADITLTGEVERWKEKFQKLISFMMAEIHQSGIDYDEIEIKKAIAQNKQAVLLWQSMISWDTKLQLKAMGRSTPVEGDRSKHRTGVIPGLQ